MGQLLGKQIQPRALAKLAYDVGIKDAHQLVIAVAVALSESQGFDHAFNDNLEAGTGDTLSRDVGIWQINIPESKIGTDAELALYDPVQNAAAMFALYSARKWQPWVAFNTGVYLHDSYLRRASLGVMNHLAETLVLTARNIGQAPQTRIPMITAGQLAKLYP